MTKRIAAVLLTLATTVVVSPWLKEWVEDYVCLPTVPGVGNKPCHFSGRLI
jgi:hypothetical protein